MTAVQASQFLRGLLVGKYRSMWAGLSGVDVAADEFHEASICLVIAASRRRGLSDEALAVEGRKFKDRVSRALHAHPERVVLTRPTIDLFVTAFAMATADQKRLHTLRAARADSRVLDAGDAQVGDLHRSAYETVAVVEEHRVGADRLPAAHLTTHTIRALDDGVGSHLYAFDSDALLLDVLEGGRPRGGPPTEVAEGVYGLEIDLTRQLKRGESTTLKYMSKFAYASVPLPEFRRGTVGVIHSVSIRVTFAPESIPASIYAAEWQTLTSSPSDSRIVIPVDGVVERFDERLEAGLVGFWWKWD